MGDVQESSPHGWRNSRRVHNGSRKSKEALSPRRKAASRDQRQQRFPTCQQLQMQLLHLSRSSKHRIAVHSTHMLLVDEPEAIVTAIEDVVQSIRNHAPLN